MKKRIYIICITICAVFGMAAAAEAQRDLFDVYLTTGYGFGMGGYLIDQSYTGTSPYVNVPTTRTDYYLNLGQGLKIEAGCDYKLMDHLYAQGAITCDFGIPGITAKHQTPVNPATYDYSWSNYGFKAMLKPTFQVLDLLDFYTDFGIGLFFANANSKGSLSADGDNGTYTFSPAIALTGAIGMNYPISPSAILFGEIVCEQMTFTCNKIEYGNRTVNYEEDVTSSAAPPKIPATNVALRVGVKFPIF